MTNSYCICNENLEKPILHNKDAVIWVTNLEQVVARAKVDRLHKATQLEEKWLLKMSKYPKSEKEKTF